MPCPSGNAIINYVRCALKCTKITSLLYGFILWDAHKLLDRHLNVIVNNNLLPIMGYILQWACSLTHVRECNIFSCDICHLKVYISENSPQILNFL